MRQELVPCLLGSLQAGYVGFRPLVVGLQRRSCGSPTACHASSVWLKRSPVSRTSLPGLALGPPAERFILRRLRCSLVVESGALSGLGGVARRCAGPTASAALAQVSAVLFRERQKAPGVGQFARAVRRDRPGQLYPLVV